MHRSPYCQRASESQKEGKWKDALKHLREGVAAGDGYAMAWLGDCYMFDYWIDVNKRDKHDKARHYYEMSAETGNTRGMIKYVETNFGDSRKKEKYEQILKTFADTDRYAEGYIFKEEFFNIQRDNQRAIECFKSSDDEDSLTQLAYCYRNEGNWTKAIECFRLAAETGNPDAQELFAYFSDSKEESIYWYKKSIAHGNKSLAHVACCLAEKYLTINKAAALYWYKRIKQFDPHYSFNPKKFNEQKEVFAGIKKCQNACFILVLIRKHRQSILNSLPKDVIILIGKILWQSREDECWQLQRLNKKLKL
jgi:TPR repeat protein